MDPGSRHTGWGVVEVSGSEVSLVACGVISTAKESVFSDRLVRIHAELVQIVEDYAPIGAAVESVFMARNAQSALKLGHARGAALLALAQGGIAVEEYAPRQVKQAVTGNGGADKAQVARMVEMLLGPTGTVSRDATDALAIALCHAAINGTRSRLEEGEGH